MWQRQEQQVTEAWILNKSWIVSLLMTNIKLGDLGMITSREASLLLLLMIFIFYFRTYSTFSLVHKIPVMNLWTSSQQMQTHLSTFKCYINEETLYNETFWRRFMSEVMIMTKLRMDKVAETRGFTIFSADLRILQQELRQQQLG